MHVNDRMISEKMLNKFWQCKKCLEAIFVYIFFYSVKSINFDFQLA